ncbi:hypothetical protein [Nocardiopsis xinjiangensis]|uniref:hypothetical protein n=1 Tax=Nocardiopsis xinjiangensis TaxID=124285 RepID=UPI000349098C|nr:hypothetical protein [Nocardiopsis xinjiangensis]
MRLWTVRQWTAAALGTVGALVLLGTPSVLLPNDLFVREVEAVWWMYPVWVATAALGGLLLATYTRPHGGRAPERTEEDEDRSTPRRGLVGGLLAWFAIGCPTCNTLVLMALGTSGALSWFAPLQPLLAVAGLALLALALRARLRTAAACRVRTGAPAG